MSNFLLRGSLQKFVRHNSNSSNFFNNGWPYGTLEFFTKNSAGIGVVISIGTVSLTLINYMNKWSVVPIVERMRHIENRMDHIESHMVTMETHIEKNMINMETRIENSINNKFIELKDYIVRIEEHYSKLDEVDCTAINFYWNLKYHLL
ncbi:hypothetical protein Glove_117g529 [Diversispora epigaea]|uniref:Uncharacterized protein n=1 Tax=Diversispora epigaea TaxID=1348612 RepID=A0A397JAP6_9GLOM|nr:hypothetical protein Glove_117g529 [Diversispora epigaea]